MTQKDLNNWIMYHEIQKLHRLGFSAAKIARYLVLDARTTNKYLKMNEQEYEQFLVHSSVRNKTLTNYEKFVTDKLKDYPDTSAAQIHDWHATQKCFNFLTPPHKNFEMPSHIAHIAKAPQADATTKALSKSAILRTHLRKTLTIFVF